MRNEPRAMDGFWMIVGFLGCLAGVVLVGQLATAGLHGDVILGAIPTVLVVVALFGFVALGVGALVFGAVAFVAWVAGQGRRAP